MRRTIGAAFSLGVVAMLLFAAMVASAELLIPRESVWRYRDDGNDQASAWKERVFPPEVGWSSGVAELGFGDGTSGAEGTPVACAPQGVGCNSSSQGYITHYFRHHFELGEPDIFDGLILRTRYDDGVIVYLNGHEVYRDNLPEDFPEPGDPGYVPGYEVLALSHRSGSNETVFEERIINPELLIAGDNVVAVEVHQQSRSSTDMSFDLELEAVFGDPPPENRRIPYQGQLQRDSLPANVPATFQIFQGGERVWGPELHQVSVDADGRFSVVLGSTNLDLDADGIADLDQIIVDDLELELEVSVKGSSGQFVPLVPRPRLVPAFHSVSAASVVEESIRWESLAPSVSGGLIPVGGVVAFAAGDDRIPHGWLLCDGRSLEAENYPGLRAAIASNHGGSGPSFRLPDYRGRLLRGVDSGTGRDREALQRQPMNSGGAAGDRVGSVQGTAIDDHTHALDYGHLSVIDKGYTFVNPPPEPEQRFATMRIGFGVHYVEINHGLPGGGLTYTDSDPTTMIGNANGPEEMQIDDAYVNWIIRCGPNDDC